MTSSMLSLSSDTSFHFELLRPLSHARYRGADITDVLQAAALVKPGDFESWYQTWRQIAERTEKSISYQFDTPSDTITRRNPVGECDKLLAAATYYRIADFFMHGNQDDPRIMEVWEQQTKCFDRALKNLGYKASRHVAKADGFDVPMIFYQALENGGPRKATIVMGNGYDGSQEELLHQSGLAALQSGYNVLTYEGPGQPSVRRYQNKGFIHDWERAVTPVIDFAISQPIVDPERIALLGVSLGGYFCLRAAAFEKRIKAGIAVDGVWSFKRAMDKFIPKETRDLLDQGKAGEFDVAFTKKLSDPNTPTVLRWGFSQGLWSFNTTSPAELVQRASQFDLSGLEDRITCPVFDADAEEDIFFAGQPEMVKERLGDNVTLRKYTSADGGMAHSQIGACSLLNAEVLAWLAEKMPPKPVS
ncbi:MAG: hypothetical protein Q9162_000745 [Coniocarpon cinnabarinum]